VAGSEVAALGLDALGKVTPVIDAALARDGYVRVERALDPGFCNEVVDATFQRAGIDDRDPTTWPAEVRHLPVTTSWRLSDVAPTVMPVLDDLVGLDAVVFAEVQDNLIVNPPRPAAEWWPPGAGDVEAAGWHKDGDWFRHFLDSPEQGLLVVVFWRDVCERQGPTYVAVDSITPIARLLAAHPEGLEPAEMVARSRAIVADCVDFRPLTGTQGDIVFAHPFLLHTASINALDALRVISNTSVMLREPIDLAAPTTAVARSIAVALGSPGGVTFEATGERGEVEAERAVRWRAETDR
jgi:hypothetical protein